MLTGRTGTGRPRLFLAGSAIARFGPGIALAVVVVFAVVLRLDAIGSQLHIDDAYTWLVASSPSPHAFFSRLAANENTPPLSYLLLAPLPIDHPGWLRAPAAAAGVLMAPISYWALRRPLGVRAALLAALAVAVAPFLVTDSDLARGFMLEDLALLVALGAVLQLDERESPGPWAAYVAAGIVAIYTEYDAAIFLLGLLSVAVWTGRPRRRSLILAGLAPFAALIPWIPQMVRAENQIGVTKLNPMNGATSLTQLRDATATLALGENGGTTSAIGRWVMFVVMLGLAAAGVVVMRRSWSSRGQAWRRAVLTIAATALLTLIGHALAGAVGIEIFTQRYLTILVPLVAGLAAVALAGLPWRLPIRIAAVALVGLGLVNIVKRAGGAYEPAFAPVRVRAIADRPRTVLTNTPIVLYYLRSLHPIMDRPYNLEPGLQGRCAAPCLVIDDSRVPGGSPRPVIGPRDVIGPYVLTLER